MCVMSSDNKIYRQTILEIVHLIQDGFAFVTGGRDRDGRPIITFPDRHVKAEFTDSEFRQMLEYFTAVPPPEDVENGFIIIIDRRTSTWSRVRSLIQRIESFFPAQIVTIFIIGPSGFMQRLVSELKMSLIRSGAKLQANQLVMINPISDLLSYVDRSQLIRELDGTHAYNHDEWIEHRAAVENFAVKESCIACNVRELCSSFVRMEMPTALPEARGVVEKKRKSRDDVMSDLNKSVETGLALLNDIRSHRGKNDNPMATLTPDKRIHIICIERAIGRLQECRQKFEGFWCDHDVYLQWALRYSEFIQEASQVQYKLDDLINAFDVLCSDTSSEGVDRSLLELEQRRAELGTAESDRTEVVKTGETLLSATPSVEESKLSVFNSLRPMSAEMCDEVKTRSHEVQSLCDSLPKLGQTAQVKLDHIHETLIQLQKVYKHITECQNWRNKGTRLLVQHSRETNSVQVRREAIAEMKAFLISKPDLKGLETLQEELSEETKGSVLELRAAIGQMQTDCERLIEKLDAANNAATAATRSGKSARRESDDAAMRRRKCFTLEGLGKQLSPALYYHDRRKPASVGDEADDDEDEEDENRDKEETDSHISTVSQEEDDDDSAVCTNLSQEEISAWTSSLTAPLPGNNNCSFCLFNDKCVSASCLSDREVTADMINGNSSPDTKIEDSDHRLQIRKHVMRELIETERVYVESLQRIYNIFWTEIDNPTNGNFVPKELKEDRRSLFGNWEDLLKFHKTVLLKKLESCVDQPGEMSGCFQESRDAFEKYSDYCMNKSYADALLRRLGGDQHPFIRHCQTLLNHNLPLSSFLLKPVQRVQKYQLLLKEMLKNTPAQSEEAAQLEAALNTMLRILRYLNDSMVLRDIVDITRLNNRELGRLLLHETFQVSAEQKETKSGRTKLKERHVILFENTLLVCKKRLAGKNQEKVEYHTVHELSMNEIGLTESTKSISDRRFEVWVNNRRLILTLQAPTVEVKSTWTHQLQDLLYAQFEQLREKVKMQRDKSNSQSVSAVSSPSPTSKVMKIVTPSPTTPGSKGIRSSTCDDDGDRGTSEKAMDTQFTSGPYPVTQV